MKFLSVCSGIEAASVAWSPLGWKAVAFSEIEPFPCAVLAHHYPDTPNWGDMTKYKEWPDVSIDLLCGGTPCQSFSVAGLRKGLDDPRGNLMLTFGAIAAKYKPNWIMWENVPGVLSSNGGNDFRSFLDMLEELGYVCDIEILDAQYFGVAQRRRRVFVCGQHRNDLLSQRTDTSALTITQCLQEILQAILIEGCSRSGSAPANSDSPSLSKDGAIRRMRLFGLDGASECWPMLRENLTAAFQRCQQGQKHSDAHPGESEKELTQAGQLTGLQAENLSTLTEKSLKNALDEAFAVMKLFTTSTVTSSITPAQIFSCSKAALLIAKLTRRLNQSSPAFWSSALSSLTAVEEFINYARSTSSDLFGDLERVQAWLDFIEQAEHTSESFLDIGIECFGEIFPLPDCLQGHPAPRRQAGQAVTPTIRAGASNGGAGHGARSGDSKDELIVPVETLCVATGQAGAEIGADMAPTLNCNHEAPYVAHSLRREGFDAGEDGTGRGTPLVPVGVTIHGTNGTATVASYTDTAQCLRARAPGFLDNSSTTVGQQPVPFDTTQITSATNRSNTRPGDTCYTLAKGAHAPAIAFSEIAACRLSATGAGFLTGNEQMSIEQNVAGVGTPSGLKVRRLTPEECEALQGFPRGYTAIPWRGKPADQCPDGPRYKALGNSWAVPCARWIGERIEAVEAIK